MCSPLLCVHGCTIVTVAQEREREKAELQESRRIDLSWVEFLRREKIAKLKLKKISAVLFKRRCTDSLGVE